MADQASGSPFQAGSAIAAKTKCRWITWHEALKHFAMYRSTTQSQGHIKPLHWYCACRLVYEGGFHPNEISPRPPFDVAPRRNRLQLSHAPEKAGWSEATLLGGLKTKDVDVVVTKDGIGPVLAVSFKGVTGAFRNLTNRMEETVGECTNLHLTYPALVFGFAVILRGNRAGKANDVAINKDGRPAEGIVRFHASLVELTGRSGVRNGPSRYEAIAMTLVETRPKDVGKEVPDYPPSTSPLCYSEFFHTLYQRYDERFVYGAPALKKVTRRIEWSPTSPAVREPVPGLDYEPRVSFP